MPMFYIHLFVISSLWRLINYFIYFTRDSYQSELGVKINKDVNLVIREAANSKYTVIESKKITENLVKIFYYPLTFDVQWVYFKRGEIFKKPQAHFKVK